LKTVLLYISFNKVFYNLYFCVIEISCLLRGKRQCARPCWFLALCSFTAGTGK